MYCKNCHREFDEKNINISNEYGEAWGSTYLEQTKVCPYCSSPCITDTYCHCNNCGNVCEIEYIETNDGLHYCDNCYTIKYMED